MRGEPPTVHLSSIQSHGPEKPCTKAIGFSLTLLCKPHQLSSGITQKLGKTLSNSGYRGYVEICRGYIKEVVEDTGIGFPEMGPIFGGP